MSNLSFFSLMGVSVSVSVSGRLKLSGLSKIPSDDADRAISYAKKHKGQLLAKLQSNLAQCETCPAAGYWNFIGPGKWCFHSAYFLGKSAQPVRCRTSRQDCPLRKNGS